MMLAFFERHAHSFHVAANVKVDMGEAQRPAVPIIIGNDDIILPPGAQR
jgi:hypothetical protein